MAKKVKSQEQGPTPKGSPLAKARAWWKKQIDAGRYVVSATEFPAPAIARVLKYERLVLEIANKRVWILTAPDRTDERGIFVANYWPVIAQVMERYSPAAVSGLHAVRLHMGEAVPPQSLSVLHAANKSEYTIDLFPEFAVQMRPDLMNRDKIVQIQVCGVDMPVLSSAVLLTTLDLNDLEQGIEITSSWLRHLVIPNPELQVAITNRPRPVILQRFSLLARQLGNTSLADQLDAAVAGITEFPVPVSATGVNTKLRIPSAATSIPRHSSTPWLDRQAIALEKYELVLNETIDNYPDLYNSIVPGFPVPKLIANAQRAKTYDAYHNTTMEGYKISREVSDAIASGSPLPDTFKSQEELRAVMAVQGYSMAFDEVVQRATAKEPEKVTEDLILDLYGLLFRPSVDAGLVKPEDLRGWRRQMVGLQGGWLHVPPNWKKVPDLMNGLVSWIREPHNSAIRAVIAHVEFVGIHPFVDGNGRVGRLLMNYTLLASRLPWITIRNDERIPYFRALESAQIHENTEPIGRFLFHHMTQAVIDINLQGKSRKSR